MIGKKLGHYRIRSKLGEGGMGEVYEAEDTKLKRKVAIKVLPEEVSSSRAKLERFQREAEAIAALDHPNIVTIHSIDEEDGVRFLTMSLVDGQPLDRVIPEKGFDLRTFFEMAIPLADALAAAHGHGVIHRDMKPANVMVTEDRRIKVLDFGLAKLKTADTRDERRTITLTSDGLVMGTIPYMSPEQVEGKEVDHTTDIFSLGVVLYEMATGHRPYRADSAAGLVSSILRDTPPPVNEVRTTLPRRLGEIVGRCLEKSSSRRYASASDLRDELRALHEEVSSGARLATGAAARTTVTAKRGLPGWTGYAVLFAIVVTSMWLMSRGGPRKPAERPGAPVAAAEVGASVPGVAVLPLANLSGDPEKEYFADGMTETLITDLAKIRGLRVISRGSVMRYKGTEMATPEIAQELGVEYVLEGSVALVGDRVRITAQLVRAADSGHLWAENYEENLEDILTVQGRVARAVATQVQVQLTPQEETRLSGATVNPEAYRLYLMGRYHWNQRTIDGFNRSLDYFRQSAEKDPDLALAWAGTADAYTLLGEYSAMLPSEAFPLASQAARKALELDESLGEAHATLGELCHYYDRDAAQSEAAFRRALELAPGYATAYHWYGDFLAMVKRFDEAIPVIERAIELDPHSPIIRFSRVIILTDARRLDRALAMSREDVAREADFWLHHFGLAFVLLARGEWTEAAEAARRAVALSDGNVWADAFLVFALARSGGEEEARAIVAGLEARAHDEFVSPTWRAIAHLGMGDHDRAIELLDEALTLREPMVNAINVWPVYDDLRGDPRFDVLLQRLGLPG